MRWVCAIGLCSLAFAAAPTCAGTLEKPEVVDAPGDVKTSVVSSPDLPFRDQLDLVSFWVTRPDPDRLDLHLRVFSLDPIDKPAPGQTDVPPNLQWEVSFDSPRGAYHITVNYRDAGWTYMMRDYQGHRGAIYGRPVAITDEILLNIPSANMTRSEIALNLTNFRLSANSYLPFWYNDAAEGGSASYLEPVQRLTPKAGPAGAAAAQKSPGPASMWFLLGLVGAVVWARRSLKP